MSETSDKPDAEADDKARRKEIDKRLTERVAALLASSPVRSEGRVTLTGGRVLAYDVHAGYVPVTPAGLDAAGQEPQAAVFTVAYFAKPDDSAADKSATAPRPVCFAFNGGPGSASIWLHLGALGPKRVRIHDDGTMPPPPYAVVDNPLTWLEHFDLVFVDPPQTGFSIAADEAARKKLLSLEGDAKALAEVVRAWLARHRAFGRPVYVAGESYGTTRGALLANLLHDHGIALAGVILVSCAMDLQTLVFMPGNHLPYALFLPGFANTAQYHGTLKGPLAASPAAAREAAEAFVADDYLAALHAGSRLEGRQRTRIAGRVAELTGLPRALVEEKNLRIDEMTFFFDALRDRGRIVGRLESRVTGPMAASRTRDWEFDPGIEALNAPYTMAALNYFAELGIDIEPRYEVLSMAAHESWNWNREKQQGNAFACTSPELARAMRRNPHLRVFVASGRYDLGTPYSASDWSLAQLDAPPDVLKRLEHHYYDAGHMMYSRQADLEKLKADLAAWLSGT
jgi:carboxypeptidase C (cathepsin A)